MVFVIKVQVKNPDLFWLPDADMLSWFFNVEIFVLVRFIEDRGLCIQYDNRIFYVAIKVIVKCLVNPYKLGKTLKYNTNTVSQLY